MATLVTPAAGIWSSPTDFHTRSHFVDDFYGGGGTDGAIGALGWGAGGTISAVTGVANNPGLVGLATGASSGTYARLNMYGGGIQLLSANDFDLSWVFKVGTTDVDTTIRAGLSSGWASNPATNGIYFEKAAADTNWFTTTRATTETRTDTGIAVSTASYITVRMVRTSGLVLFYFNGALVATHTTTIPTAAVGPGIHILNSAAANKTMTVDYFEMTIGGLTR